MEKLSWSWYDISKKNTPHGRDDGAREREGDGEDHGIWQSRPEKAQKTGRNTVGPLPGDDRYPDRPDPGGFLRRNALHKSDGRGAVL